MSKTLQQERNDWESRDRMTQITHFEMAHRGTHITILVESELDARDNAILYYDLIRYFQIDGDWVASLDVKSGSAHDIMRKFAELV